jgi:hypothetical protein
MAYSSISYKGDGVLMQFPLPFEYILPIEIFVSVNGLTKILNTDYVLEVGIVRFITTPPPSASTVKIMRRTNLATQKVQWKEPSIMTAADLNLNTKQLFFIEQELYDMIVDLSTALGNNTPVVTTTVKASDLMAGLSQFLINHTTSLYP